MWTQRKAEMRLHALRAVNAKTDYANNHLVSAVGYYHAASKVWHERPWNEYREGLGYYWNGEWHLEPDQRQVASSAPIPGEIDRVNGLWFAANPGKKFLYDEEVERSGFGGSNGRTSGS